MAITVWHVSRRGKQINAVGIGASILQKKKRSIEMCLDPLQEVHQMKSNKRQSSTLQFKGRDVY